MPRWVFGRIARPARRVDVEPEQGGMNVAIDGGSSIGEGAT